MSRYLTQRDAINGNFLDLLEEYQERIERLERYWVTQNATDGQYIARDGYLVNSRLAAAVAATGTTISVDLVPQGITADLGYVVIDPYTSECEVRKATAISGGGVTIAALTYAHDLNDMVLWIPAAVLKAKWFGASAGTVDNSMALIRGLTQASALSGALDLDEVYPITADVTVPSNVRIFSSNGLGGIDVDIASGNGGFHIEEKSNIIIEGLRILDCEAVNGILVRSQTAGTPCRNIYIRNNRIVQVQNASVNNAAVDIIWNCQNVHVIGNEIDAPNLAVLVQGASSFGECTDIIIADNTIKALSPNFTSGNEMIKVDVETRRVNVENNIVNGGYLSCITVEEGALDCMIVNNNLFPTYNANAGARGIRIEAGQTSVAVERLTCRGNHIYCNDGVNKAPYGIWVGAIAALTDSEIVDNYIYDAGTNGIHADGTDCVYQANKLFNCNIKAIAGVRLIFKDNVIIDPGNVAMELARTSATDGDTFEIEGNYLYGFNQRGIQLTKVSNPIIAHNVLRTGATLADASSHYPIWYYGSGSDTTGGNIHGNTILCPNADYGIRVQTLQGTVYIKNNLLDCVNREDPKVGGGTALYIRDRSKTWLVGSAAPTTGTWVRGDVMWNEAPSASGAIGWVCTAGGTPGTWKTFGTIAA